MFGVQLRSGSCFLLSFAVGKSVGTPCMPSHTDVHPATTICFVNPFVFKTKIEKEGLPRDGPAGLGAGGPRFKSGRPDQNISCHFSRLCEHLFTSKASVENKETGVQGSHVVQTKKFTSLLISAQEPGRRRASAKNSGKTQGFEAKKNCSRGKIQGT